MSILFSRPYQSYAAGAIATLSASTEAALIAQGFGVASAAVVTTGPQTQVQMRGTVAIPAAAISVVVTNPYIDSTSIVFAQVAQAAADATLLRVERTACANGSFTIFGTAAATAATVVNWVAFNNLSTYATN
jgi:hypothetical protein